VGLDDELPAGEVQPVLHETAETGPGR
jgi:hypothetical protein